MALLPEEWFNEFERMRRSMINLGREAGFQAGNRLKGLLSMPVVDISETKTEVIVKVDLPGVRKEDVELFITPNALEIKAEIRKEKKQETESMFRSERSYAGYQRVLSLPAEVKTKDYKTDLTNGVLTVTLKKAHPEKAVKKEKEKKKVKARIK